MSRVGPNLFGAGESELVLFHTADQCTDKKDQSEFAPVVEIRRSDVGVDLVQRGELDVARGGPVEIGRLHDQTGVRRVLKDRKES